ncbi:hypothetical protein G7Z17_g5100 [Cylindrodendrum hubeiense]|uniref:Nephrocystin 3-like N-terminal domain-containing protein n=1 Tax=Cylindrodendrum hubeiense TaxID=595255 RepID=A0A9P5LGI5_9HYPO|nr:hypothetical protein G7Z17_g5100 [Cylindrodendrum hubeiense]
MPNSNIEIGEAEQAVSGEQKRWKVDHNCHSTELTHDNYTVGWVCALPKEQTAATAMLDQRHADLLKPSNDSNTYTLGSIGKHCIVIACLPKGEIGTNSAATVAAQMVRTFPSLKFGLMVGIGGGIPPKVRLGDVVVSTPVGQFSGVVQWDLGKANQGGNFERTGSLNYPPASLRTALTNLETKHDLEGTKIPEYLDELKQKWPKLAAKYTRSETLMDPLDAPDTSHHGPSSWQATFSMFCEMILAVLGYLLGLQAFATRDRVAARAGSTMGTTVDPEKRKPREIRVHYGLIASGNQVIKDAAFRDKLNKDLGGHVRCVEMEAAGLMNNFPCIVIRGICDYADSRKNKDWQEYAAAVAAAFAKELLGCVQPSEVDRERTVKDILGTALELLDEIQQDAATVRVKMEKKEDLDILNWLTPIDYGPQHSDFLKMRQPGTGQWLLDSIEYQTWVNTDKQTLFCPGIPGAGKTVLTAVTIEDITTRYQSNPDIGIAYLYCNFRQKDEQKAQELVANLLKQLSQERSSLPDIVKSLYDRHKTKQTRPSFDELTTSLHIVAAMYSRVFIVVDALDECQVTDGCRMRFLTEIFILQTKTGANLFATSRPNIDIEAKFEGCPSYNILAREDDSFDMLLRQAFTVIKKWPGHSKYSQYFPKQRTATHIVAYFGLAEAVANLLEAKNEVDPIDQDSRTPLSFAAEHGHEATVKVLLAHGAKTESKDKFDRTPLSFAAGEGHEAIVKLLLEQRADIDSKNTNNQTPLSFAVGNGHLTIVKILLAQGAETDFEAITKSFYIQTPLSIAAKEGHEAIVELLLAQGAEVDLKDTNSRTPLSFAAGEGSESVVKLLLAHGAEADSKNGSDQTPLNFAAKNGHEAIVKLLLVQGSEAESKDMYGRPPLMCAAENGHEAIVKLLLAQGAESDSKDICGRTPLSYAAEEGHESIVKLLLEQGAEADSKVTKNGRDRTPLSFAAENGHDTIIKLLLAQGVESDSKDTFGRTPLSFAAEEGNESIVKLLLTDGAEVDSKNRRGWTPLRFAAEGGHKATVKLLLAHGSEADSKDTYSQTPLHIAAEHGLEVIVKLLLAHGAEAESKDQAGRTPLSVAAEKGHASVIKLLRPKI